MAIAKAQVDLQQLRERMGDLKKQLADLERQEIKLVHFLEVAGIYSLDLPHVDQKGDSTPPLDLHSDAETVTHTLGKLPRNLPPSVRAVIDILQTEGRPIKTRDLVQRLSSLGINKEAKMPVARLSGTLSRYSTIFTADRNVGWSLVQWL